MNETDTETAQLLGQVCAAGYHVWAVRNGLALISNDLTIDETADGVEFDAVDTSGQRMRVTVSCRPIT